MKKNDLIDNIMETEHFYSLEFSRSERTEWGVRYSDSELPDMHCHNFLRLDPRDPADFLEAVRAERSFRRAGKQEAVQVELFGGDFDAVADIAGADNLDEHLILYCPVSDLNLEGRNKDALVVRALTEADLSKGKLVDRLTFGLEYASFSDSRFDRKAVRYRDESSAMNHFVCLDGEDPVGNCDFFHHGLFGKIEDFDVIEEHQRKGFGSALINGVKTYAEERNVQYLFLQVEKENTALEMYKKLGFIELFNNIIYNKPVEEN